MRYFYALGAAMVLLACLVVGYMFIFFRPSENIHPAVPVIQKIEVPIVQKIGTSVEGRAIERYLYGKGNKHALFVGGMHGGYEWNSVTLAYQYIDYLSENPLAVPSGITVAVIPDLNPDGVFKVTGKEGRFSKNDVSEDSKVLAEGRFNAHDVDLNRNFDCKWKPTGTWQSKTVSAGDSAFSEPETAALKRFVLEFKPDVVVFWHSKANAVYASECENGILPETTANMNAYAKASKYPAVESFTAYPVSGDAEGWLASINVPAITVELQSHESVEWERNLAGINALLSHVRVQRAEEK